MEGIPKTINYCWFGKGKKSKLFEKCINSWKKYMQDYEIKEWDEDNFDVNQNDYCREAYLNKKWAFVSDYARLKIIYDNGGIYLDTDVEIIKSLLPIIEKGGYLGIESSGKVATGLGFAARKNDKTIGKMLKDYDKIHFEKDGKFDLTPCPIRNTASIEKIKKINKSEITQVEDLFIYPAEYFCGYNQDINSIDVTPNTYTIHHYEGTWLKRSDRSKTKLKKAVLKIIGEKNYNILQRKKRKWKKNEE